jgi:hypothetical protein
MYSGKVVMSRRKEAEGLIYTGKCQGTKQWPILPHHISIRFGLGFFKYPFYSRILVLLIFLYSKLKLLLSLGRYSA